MALQLIIAGVDRTGMLAPGSLSIPDRLGERSEASFTLIDKAGGFHPLPFDSVRILLDGATIMEGFLWDPEEELLVPDFNRAEVTITAKAVDLHMLADRRVVNEAYDGWRVGAIARDLLAKYLADDGVTAGTIQDGPTVTRAVFPYAPLSECLDQLAELAGFYWLIRPGRILDLAAQDTNLAPWSLTTGAKVRNVRVRRHREDYRNRQYVPGGYDTTNPLPADFAGDGTRKTFTVPLPIAKVPTVEVDGAPQSVGIGGVDTGKAWYWNKGTPNVSQDAAATPLAAAQTLHIVYQGLYPAVAVAEDREQIASRAAAEGTSGIWEAVDSKSDLDSATAAVEWAHAKLTKYSRVNGEITFETEVPGLKAGHLLTVDLPMHGLDGQYLIEEVAFSDIGAARLGVYRYQVRALDGGAVGGWIQFFKALTSAGKTFTIQDGELLVKDMILSDVANVMEGHTVNVAGLTESPDPGLLTINVQGVTDAPDPAAATYNAVGITEPPDPSLPSVNLLGITDPVDYDPACPVWAVQGVTAGAAGAVQVWGFAPVTTVGMAQVGYSEVA